MFGTGSDDNSVMHLSLDGWQRMGTDSHHSSRLVSAQLRIGDTDHSSHSADDILKKIDAAIDLAGLRRLLYQPSRKTETNQLVVDHCRKRGIEVFMWYPVLGNNDCIPDSDELMQDALGGKRPGVGRTGAWADLPLLEDNYLAACPTNKNYGRIVLERCQRMLPDYDGLYLDAIGYPLPSLGFESVFTCFCPNCHSLEPRLKHWHEAAIDLKDRLIYVTDEHLEQWGSLEELLQDYDLIEFYAYRIGLVNNLVKRYADMARAMGKQVGVDVLSPAFARLAGHDFAALGRIVDWLKPRMYCHTFGPSSIPLEFYCMTMGLKNWAKRISIGCALKFIGRLTNLAVPTQLQLLRESFRSEKIVAEQIARASAATAAPVYPGIECSLEPEFENVIDDEAVSLYLGAAKGAPGIVLCWNLLYIPDAFLKLAGAQDLGT